MLERVAGYPEPRAAKLNGESLELQQQLYNLPELLRGLGGLVCLVCGGVVLILEDFVQLVIFGVNLLHGGGVSASVGVVLHDQAAVGCFQLVQGLNVFEVHVLSPFISGAKPPEPFGSIRGVGA